METSSRRLVAKSGGARQCVPACDKEETASSIAAAAKLEFANRGNNTLLTHEDSSISARLLVAVRRGKDALPFGKVDRHQGCLVHLPAHLLQPSPRQEAACCSLQPHRRLDE